MEEVLVQKESKEVENNTAIVEEAIVEERIYKKRIRHNISDDDKLEIIDMLEKGKSVKEVSEKMGYAQNTIYNIANKFNVDYKRKSQSNQKEKSDDNSVTNNDNNNQKEVTNVDNKLSKTEDNNNSVTNNDNNNQEKVTDVGKKLSKTEEYIRSNNEKFKKEREGFTLICKDQEEVRAAIIKGDGIPNDIDIIFDKGIDESYRRYNYIYHNKVITDFIKKHINFEYDATHTKKIASKSLGIFVTKNNNDINILLPSLIKTCNDNNINLNLYHYQKELDTYAKQIVINNNSGLKYIFPSSNELYFSNILNPDDLYTSSFYTIREIEFGSPKCDIVYYTKEYVIQNINTAFWNKYMELCQDAFSNKNKYILVIADEVKATVYGYEKKVTQISVTTNFKVEAEAQEIINNI